MAQVELRDTAFCWNILEAFPIMYNSETFSDVSFLCKDGVVRAHRMFLGLFSPLLHTIFDEQSQRDSIEISIECNTEDLDNVIRFCYEGYIRMTDVEYIAFQEVCNMLGIPIRPGVNVTKEVEEIPIIISQTPRKRKPNGEMPDAPPPKLSRPSNERSEVIHQINNIIEDMRPRGVPMIVPLEQFQKFTSLLENIKAQEALKRRLESLVQAAVKSCLKEIQNIYEKRKTDRKTKNTGKHLSKPTTSQPTPPQLFVDNSQASPDNSPQGQGRVCNGGTHITSEIPRNNNIRTYGSTAGSSRMVNGNQKL